MTKPARPEQPWMLEILAGADQGKRFMVSRPDLRIGRDTGNHIILTDLKVSRSHAEFKSDSGKLHIINRSKRSTTLVEGSPIEHHEYTPGEKVQVGDTILVLRRRENLPASPPEPPHSRGMATSQGKSSRGAKKKGPSPLLWIVALFAVGAALFSGGSKKSQDGIEIVATDDVERLVLESRERQREIREQRSFASLQERKRFEAAERLHNQGFRDFQRGNYSRAIQSFRGALAADRQHTLAQRYLDLADRKQKEVIDQGLLEGRRHYEKGMYGLCESAMSKVLILINNKEDLKYQQADELREECNLRKTVM